MTNEQFLATIEPYVGTRSFEHAKKLVAVFKLAKEVVKKGMLPADLDLELRIALENLERE